ncbi:MAG: biotin synthase BioB [Nitrospirae bacterium]|nr:MAG: biotin synthase BioB [Nitrospirota bacterium]
MSTEREILKTVTELPLPELFSISNRLREEYRGDGVDLCAIVNAKSGRCSEDCHYCAQSVRYQTGIKTYPLLSDEEILNRAVEAREAGARRFCIVTSGKKPSKEELKRIGHLVSKIRDTGLLPCSTLGLLSEDEIAFLKDSGLERYHHNLETSESFFPSICTTHSYQDKLRTIESVKKLGLSLCSGGIFGLGETWHDRLEMALLLKKLDPDSVPINFLIPIEGTPLGGRESLSPVEALRIVALYRIVLENKEIRLCGGRHQTLGEFNAMVFMAGVDGLLIGNYLTRKGRSLEDDLNLIRESGLRVIP